MADEDTPSAVKPERLMELREAVEGHRKWALEAGFDESAADDLAISLHDVLVQDLH